MADNSPCLPPTPPRFHHKFTTTKHLKSLISPIKPHPPPHRKNPPKNSCYSSSQRNTHTASATKPTRATSVAGATTALVLLTALNFVNYIDRYILPGVQEQVKGEFHITDAQIGSLTLWFMIAYMATSPVTGWLGDRFPRKPMIIIAALFWSGINFFTATVHSYSSLNIRHAALGVGEASFGIFAPALLADFYPEDQRNRVLTIFNVAIPVGAALGYLIGGTVGEHFGWRMSFIVSAIPGVLIALLIAAFMREPARGASGASSTSQHGKAKLEKGTVLSLLKNKAYLSSILGYAAVTFSLGGISWWMPSFLQRIGGRSQSSSAYIMGAITVVAGLGGTIVIYSEVGLGTTVSVLLPVTEQVAAALAEPDRPLEDLRGHGESILLVEDEESLRAMASRILARNGYQVWAGRGKGIAGGKHRDSKRDARGRSRRVLFPCGLT